MEDIIDIIVTETTNLIEITSQASDETIDVNIIDNREDITLNVTPTLVEVNINQLTGNFGINWGEITGTLSNQTDLNTALGLKADLVGGKVPSSQLPSYVDDVVEVANYVALPTTGETGKIYVVLDTNLIYRWSGSAYIEIKDSSAVWGAITGTLSSQTDLQSALDAKLSTSTAASTYVPYTGATATVDIGTNLLKAGNFTAVGQGEGGVLNLYKYASRTIAGNGYVSLFANDSVFGFVDWVSANLRTAQFSLASITNNTTKTYTLPNASGTLALTSDLHNAVTIGTANGLSLSTQVLSLGLASSSTNGALSSTDWTTFNAKQQALSGTGFVKISGTTISYDNSTYLTTSSASSTYLAKTGGTLTGALNGTTAVFSGAVWGQTGYFSNTTADNAIAVVQSNTSYHAVTITATGGSALYATGTVTVVGTLTATGVLTAQSGLANGSGQSFTLPSTTGTLALTSQLSSYLPLSGGTLTGALSGTSGTFTGNVSSSNQIRLEPSANATLVIGSRSSQTDFQIYNTGNVFRIYNGALDAFTIASTSGTSIFTTNSGLSAIFSNGGAAGNYNSIELRGGTGGTAVNWQISKDNSTANAFELAPSTTNGGTTYGSPVFKILSSGAATFSSSVTMGAGLRLSSNSSEGEIVGTAGRGLKFYTNDGNSNPLNLTSAGNVGIGTTAPFSQGSGATTMELAGNTYGQFFVSANSASIRGVVMARASTLNDVYIASITNSPLLFGTNDTERMRITSGGDALIGWTGGTYNDPIFNNVLGASIRGTSTGVALIANSAGTAAYLGRKSSTGNLVDFSYNSSTVGTISTNGSSVSYNTTSDYRLKEDLKSINGLEIVNKIKVYDYKWKSSDNRMDGVLAHELAEILPYAVTGIKDGEQMQGVDYSKIVPVMVQAIKELKAELDTLKNK